MWEFSSGLEVKAVKVKAIKVKHCHYCGLGFIPGLGNFACHGHGQKKKKKKYLYDKKSWGIEKCSTKILL